MALLGNITAAAVLAVFRAFTRGSVSTDELGQLAAAEIVRGMGSGRVAALQDYAAAHYAALGTAPSSALGASASVGKSLAEHDRIAAAAVDIVTEPLETAAGEPDMRLERMAHNEVYTATQDQRTDTLAADERATGWVRGMNADACQLCRWWWREGRVWDAEHVMPTHTGCKCWQEPQFTEGTE
jgi:hypothetical protein